MKEHSVGRPIIVTYMSLLFFLLVSIRFSLSSLLEFWIQRKSGKRGRKSLWVFNLEWQGKERMRDERRLLQHERETLFFLDSLQWSIVWGEDTRKRTWNRLKRRDIERMRDREKGKKPALVVHSLDSPADTTFVLPLLLLLSLSSSVSSSFPSCPLLTDSSSFFLSFTLLKSQAALIKRLETCSILRPLLLSCSSSLPSFSQPSVLMTQVNCSPTSSSSLVSLMKLRQQQDWSKKTDIKDWQRVTESKKEDFWFKRQLKGRQRDTTFGLIYDSTYSIFTTRQLLSWPFDSQALHCIHL